MLFSHGFTQCIPIALGYGVPVVYVLLRYATYTTSITLWVGFVNLTEKSGKNRCLLKPCVDLVIYTLPLFIFRTINDFGKQGA